MPIAQWRRLYSPTSDADELEAEDRSPSATTATNGSLRDIAGILSRGSGT